MVPGTINANFNVKIGRIIHYCKFLKSYYMNLPFWGMKSFKMWIYVNYYALQGSRRRATTRVAPTLLVSLCSKTLTENIKNVLVVSDKPGADSTDLTAESTDH
jgi:hypothetical protein